MAYIYLEATHHEFDPTLGERSRLICTKAIPKVGELAPIAGQRLWSLVAIDEYRLVEQTHPEQTAEPAIFLGHCAQRQETLPERKRWARIEMYQENPLTILQLFVSPEQNLIQSSIHLYGKRALVGSHLRQYDRLKREFMQTPWQVSRMDTYLPESSINPYYCYAAIHVAHCLHVAIMEEQQEAIAKAVG